MSTPIARASQHATRSLVSTIHSAKCVVSSAPRCVFRDIMDKLPPPYPLNPPEYTRRRSVTLRFCPSAGTKKGNSLLKPIPEYTVNKQSEEYQTTAWKILQKSISNLIKNVNSEDKAKEIKKKVVRLNILRGRGLFCKNIMEAQLASTDKTQLYAFFISLIHTEIPTIGELLLTRCFQQFQDANITKEKCEYLASVLFISYLINYDVVSPVVAVKILKILVNVPTQDSIDAAFVVLNTCGHKLSDNNKMEVDNLLNAVHKTTVYNRRFGKKIKYMIQIIMQSILLKNVLKSKDVTVYRIPMNISLETEINPEYYMDSYFYDPDYDGNEQMYSLFCNQVLETDVKDEYILMYDNNTYTKGIKQQNKLVIKHSGNPKIDKNSKTLKDLIEYLMDSSLFKYENCASQLMKIKLNSGQEVEICLLFLELCCEHDVYTENLGHITQIFCQLNRLIIGPLEKLFVDTYAIVNSFDTIILQNVAKYFAQLLYSDTISWTVLSAIRLNEIETTASTGKFVKHLFRELVKHLGEENLNYYVQDPALKDAFEGIFLGNKQNNPNFSAEFFSSIGLAGLINKFENSLLF